MVNWHRIEVPRLEWPLAYALGAERSNGAMWCTATQHRSKPFRRWHSAANHMKVVVYPGDGRKAREEAKQNCCRWDPVAREWFVAVTSESSLPWHMAPRPHGSAARVRHPCRIRGARCGQGCGLQVAPGDQAVGFRVPRPAAGVRAEACDCGVKEHHSQALARASVRRVAHGAAQGALDALSNARSAHSNGTPR